MKKFLCLALICVFTICAMAQDAGDFKVVRLKSGINITGIVTNNADGSISVTTADGDILQYQSAEVISVKTTAEEQAREKSETKRNNKIKIVDSENANQFNSDIVKEKGFQFSVETFCGFGEIDIYGLEIAPSIRINKYFLLGVGVGCMNEKWIEHSFNSYSSSYAYFSWINEEEENHVSWLLETFARYNILAKRVTPFIGVNFGVFDFDGIKFGTEVGCMFRNDRGRGPYVAIFYNNVDEADVIGAKVGWTF